MDQQVFWHSAEQSTAYCTCRSTTSTSIKAASSCAGCTRASQRIATAPSPPSAATMHCGTTSAQRGAASAATSRAASLPDAVAMTSSVHEEPPLVRSGLMSGLGGRGRGEKQGSGGRLGGSPCQHFKPTPLAETHEALIWASRRLLRQHLH